MNDSVRDRIESIIYCFLKEMVNENESSPYFELKRNDRENVLETESIILLGEKMKKIQWKRSPVKYGRIWHIVGVIYSLQISGSVVSMRELYYMCKSSPLFDEKVECGMISRYVNEICCLVQCKRRDLGIYASPKGLAIGNLILNDKMTKKMIDFSATQNLTDDLVMYLLDNEDVIYDSQANYILVVEKETVFKRLQNDRILKYLKAILVCGKGMPDLNSRIFLSFLSKKLDLPIYGIFDYNPGGVSILLTYMCGSISLGLESYQYVVDIKWLGLKTPQLERLNLMKNGIRFSKGDRRIMNGLLAHPKVKNDPFIFQELQSMISYDMKIEIESLTHFGLDHITHFVISEIASFKATESYN